MKIDGHLIAGIIGRGYSVIAFGLLALMALAPSSNNLEQIPEGNPKDFIGDAFKNIRGRFGKIMGKFHFCRNMSR